MPTQNDTKSLQDAGRRLARNLLKNTGHCPEIEFIGVRTTKTGCDNIATPAGFDVRIDRQAEITPEVLISRVYHAAAHMLCLQLGVSSHSGSGRHTRMFDQALEALGAPEEVKLDHFNKSQQAAAVDFDKAIKQRKRVRPATEKTAYERTTIVCPAERCRHRLTLRDSAIAKTRFLCVEHAEEMVPSE